MADLKNVVNKVLLPLQLSLGIFQIMKTTPLWAVIHCALASFLNFFYFPHTDYKHLQQFHGRVFKKVVSHTTTVGTKVKMHKDLEKPKTREGKSENVDPDKSEAVHSDTEEMQKDREKPKKEVKSGGLTRSVSVKYLGKSFELELKDGNKMVMKDGPTYCITDKMWESVEYIGKVAPKTVFVKDYKELWEEVVTGDIMKFEEVLDSVILNNRTVIRLDHDYFLPINLLRSEDKLMKILNFLGLFLKTQNQVNWLIPALLTFVSAIMGFSTILRFLIGRFTNIILCRSLQLLFDLLPLEKRRWAYSWGNWVDNLKPNNDLKSKIVRGSAVGIVAGGAKLDSQSFADLETPDAGILIKNSTRHVIVGVDVGAKAHSVSLPLMEGLGLVDHISVLVCEGVKAHHEASNGGCTESLDHLVIMADKTNIRTFLTGATNADQPDRSEFHNFSQNCDEWVHEIWPEVGPFLFECESVYIEWIYDNISQVCSVKTGLVIAPRESLTPHDICIICDDNGEDHNTGSKNDEKPSRSAFSPLRSPFSRGKEYDSSLIADGFDTSSIEVECKSEEAIKLLKFAFYMAKYKTTSLKSYDRKSKKATVRRFVESVKAYASSSYPPLYRLFMEDAVVF